MRSHGSKEQIFWPEVVVGFATSRSGAIESASGWRSRRNSKRKGFGGATRSSPSPPPPPPLSTGEAASASPTMFEGMVSQVLSGYLGRFVKGIQKDQLKIGIWNGKAVAFTFFLPRISNHLASNRRFSIFFSFTESHLTPVAPNLMVSPYLFLNGARVAR